MYVLWTRKLGGPWMLHEFVDDASLRGRQAVLADIYGWESVKFSRWTGIGSVEAVEQFRADLQSVPCRWVKMEAV